jgi:uncharacterized protein (TIGR00661 family)
MKILYAASNNLNARIQLSRFMKAMEGSNHQIKVAAYIRSSPKDINIDWTLDACCNIYRPDLISLHSDNLSIYADQIKSFNPDLVISDLEYFTSYIVNDLNITLWQCSSSMINYALSRNEKYNLGLFKYYAHSLNRDTLNSQRTINIIDNSNYNFVYSHYGDMESPPELQTGFEWIRPYHQVAKSYVPCQHNITAVLTIPDKPLINVLKKHSDSVVFVEGVHERYRDVQIKDIRITDEYYCNLKNSPLFVCQGQTSFLADAFYNGKYSLIFPDYEDAESITNSQVSQKMGTGQIVSYTDDFTTFVPRDLTPMCSDSIKYLHERIEEL